MVVALICLAAHSAHASPPTPAEDAEKPSSIAALTITEPSGPPAYPALLDSPDALMAKAASAARQDLDPRLNGSVRDTLLNTAPLVDPSLQRGFLLSP